MHYPADFEEKATEFWGSILIILDADRYQWILHR
jgi:hypothetical protein